MGNNKELWLVVADSESARLLHGTATQHDHVHLDEMGKLATTFAAGEHQRPTRLSEPGRSGPTGHESELKTAHFAREVAQWLEKELKKRGIAKCTLCAPARFLGAFRPVAGKGLAGQVIEHDAELAKLSLPDLARHPRITSLLPR